MKKILVTGGAGFIGSNFIRKVLGYDKYKIVNLDNLTYAGNLSNLDDVSDNENYRFEKASISDRNFVNELFEKEEFDCVINFAAESHVDNSIKNPSIFVETNIIGTQALLDACKANWQIGKDSYGYPLYKEGVKYVQISTDEVYGSLGKNGKFTELSPLNPNSPYSASKASADLLVKAYYETFKLPINITRCSNNYGPYQFPEKLIPLMINNCINEIDLPVYGDGMQIRDWLHVDDHCEAIELVLAEGKIGEIYNIGGNNEKANIEIVKLIIRMLNKDESLIKHVEDRLGHDRRYAIDNTKITSQLGWKPKFTFEVGIENTIKWYVENQEWLKNIKDNKI